VAAASRAAQQGQGGAVAAGVGGATMGRVDLAAGVAGQAVA